MKEKNDDKKTSISKAASIEEIAEFWDHHSLVDFWNETHEVEFEIRARRRRRVTLDPDLYEQVVEKAKIRGILPETFINLLLQEHLKSE